MLRPKQLRTCTTWQKLSNIARMPKWQNEKTLFCVPCDVQKCSTEHAQDIRHSQRHILRLACILYANLIYLSILIGAASIAHAISTSLIHSIRSVHNVLHILPTHDQGPTILPIFRGSGLLEKGKNRVQTAQIVHEVQQQQTFLPPLRSTLPCAR